MKKLTLFVSQKTGCGKSEKRNSDKLEIEYSRKVGLKAGGGWQWTGQCGANEGGNGNKFCPVKSPWPKTKTEKKSQNRGLVNGLANVAQMRAAMVASQSHIKRSHSKNQNKIEEPE